MSGNGWADCDPETGRPAIFDDPTALAKFVTLMRRVKRRQQEERARAGDDDA